MKLAIMQPYFLPYIGYFQLIASVDRFVIYDNIKYTKKGWINRNRFLMNCTDAIFSIPLKKASDFLDIVEREISPSYDRDKLLAKLRRAYSGAPYFEQTYCLLEQIVMSKEINLFHCVYRSVLQVCKHLDINTPIVISSEVPIDHCLKSEERVLAICEAYKASVYINPIGGIKLYSKQTFLRKGIDLKFIESKQSIKYKQNDCEFVPRLSIIDVLMFNPLDVVRDYVRNGYDLV